VPILQTDDVVQRFEALPLAIRSQFTLEEYMWMGEKQRETLEQRETEPEVEL